MYSIYSSAETIFNVHLTAKKCLCCQKCTCNCLFNSIAVPQSENSFLLFAWRFFSEAENTTLSYIGHTGFKGRIACEQNSLQSL